jgi:hypothetical protein
MNLSAWTRQIHRWLAVIFTLAVLANFAVMGNETIGLWVGALTLLPLFLLLFTGLYLFALPYLAARRHTGRPAQGDTER